MAGGGGAGGMGGGQPMGGGQQGGFGGQSMGGMGGMGGQPMGGYGGQQSQPMQQQMQRPMQSQFGGYNQSPQMGGFGGGMGGGFGGGFNQYNPMGGGYGMGGFSPQMGGMGGFGGGYGPQMGGFGMGGGGQPMGGYGGGMGGGFNQPPQMGGFGGGMLDNSTMTSTFPDPRMRQNQGPSMNPMQGARQMLQRFGGQQGGQGIQGLMGGMRPQLSNEERQSRMNNPAYQGLPAQPINEAGFQTDVADRMRMSEAHQQNMQQQGGQGSLRQMGGQGSMSPQTFGALSNPGGMGQIPAYARPYAQQMMGNQNFSQMSIGRPNTDSGPAPALSLDQQYQNYLGSM